MKVELSGRGLREVAKARASWQAHREHAPRLLDDELDAAVELMSNQPLVGQVWRTAGGVEIRKLALTRTDRALYYYVERERQAVVVVGLWGSRRGRAPKL